MKEKLRTLTDFKLPRMELSCAQCGRRGRYDLERLKARFGSEATIFDTIQTLVGYCPEKAVGRCRAGCNDLVWMFRPLPGSPGYDEACEKTLND